jgi:hypothetical protein
LAFRWREMADRAEAMARVIVELKHGAARWLNARPK